MSICLRSVRQSLCVIVFAACGVAVSGAGACAQQTPSFAVSFDTAAFSAPFSGDVFVAFSQDGEPRASMHQWFGAPPLARWRVSDVAPGKQVTLRLDDAVASHPADFKAVIGKSWKVQAVARVNPVSRKAGHGEGDVYSSVAQVKLKAGTTVPLPLNLVVGPPTFRQTDRVRLFSIESETLSRFHGFGYQMRAGVLLPQNHSAEKTYPVVYDITGFGGTHTSIHRKLASMPADSFLQQCIVVIPDPSNRYGHSVFCNSPSIGPWGDALVRDLMPQLEQKYGGAGAPQRYVTGVSSGGWSCLYLQLIYPTEFAGCWSHVPDPIDFHDFQQINLYDPLPDGAPRNMYRDERGKPRPLARRGGQVMLTYEEFVRREHVTNPGGQIRSFEATFSRPAADGTPQRVFDVQTGAVNHAVAKTWQPFDLSHQMLTNWENLQDDLSGKIHIFAGAEDTFYLNGAVERFQRLAKQAGLLEHMQVEVIPGMPHTLYQQGHEQMLRVMELRQQAAKQ